MDSQHSRSSNHSEQTPDNRHRGGAIHFVSSVLAGTLLSVPLLQPVDAVAQELSTTVSLKLSSNYPIIPIDINGHTLHLLFDLGEDFPLVLTPAGLAEIGVTPAGAKHAIKDVKGNAVESPTFQIQDLRIGSAVFQKVTGRVDAHDPTYRSSDVGQQGDIGPASASSPISMPSWPDAMLKATTSHPTAPTLPRRSVKCSRP